LVGPAAGLEQLLPLGGGTLTKGVEVMFDLKEAPLRVAVKDFIEGVRGLRPSAAKAGGRRLHGVER
jgi:hypothetical protein